MVKPSKMCGFFVRSCFLMIMIRQSIISEFGKKETTYGNQSKLLHLKALESLENNGKVRYPNSGKHQMKIKSG